MLPSGRLLLFMHGTLVPMNDIAYLALGCAIVVFINICIHGYQNRATNPMLKFKQWRASKV